MCQYHQQLVKTLSATCWSARADATKCLFVHYKDIRNALIDISTDNRHNIDTRAEAGGFARKIGQFETAFMTVIWHTILDRFNTTSASLQKVEIDLFTALKLYESLTTFVEEIGGSFDDMEKKVQDYVDNQQNKEAQRRVVKRKRFFNDSN